MNIKNILFVIFVAQLCEFVPSASEVDPEAKIGVVFNSTQHITSSNVSRNEEILLNSYSQSQVLDNNNEFNSTVLPLRGFDSNGVTEDSSSQSTTVSVSPSPNKERTTLADSNFNRLEPEQEDESVKDFLSDKNKLRPLKDEQEENQESHDEDNRYGEIGVESDTKHKSETDIDNNDVAGQDFEILTGPETNINRDTPKLGAGETPQDDDYIGDDEVIAKQSFPSRPRRPEFAQQPYVGDAIKFDDSSNHFFTYFVMAVLCLVVAYFVHHHRAKIGALVSSSSGPSHGHRRSGEYRLLSRRSSYGDVESAT